MCYSVTMDHKEHLLHYFLQGKISLSQYDHKFMSNLQMIAHKDKRITSNQVDLFDKLISKYARQLNKNGLDVASIQSLPWKTEIVTSSEKYTSARVSLESGKLVLRVPFNKKFISEFRNVKLNPFTWVREEKYYSADFDTNALKISYTILPSYFNMVQYSDELSILISNLEQYKSTIWEPTLVKINGNLLILAVNDILGELVKDIELKEDTITFFKLSQLGIKIHPSLITDKKLQFASESITTIDILDFDEVLLWIRELNVTDLYLGKGLDYKTNRSYQSYIVSRIEMNRMRYRDIDKTDHLKKVSPILLQYHLAPDTIKYHGDKTISKCVVIRDSRPVEVK